MKVIYRSFDNKDFQSEEVCKRHEDIIIEKISDMLQISEIGIYSNNFINANVFNDNNLNELNMMIRNSIIYCIYKNKEKLIEVLNE